MRCPVWSVGLAVSVALLTAVLVGCGGGSDEGGSGSPAGNTSQPGSTAALEGPAASVYAFLEGARTGNDAAADAMLTAVARRELAKAKLFVAPRRDDLARFVVGEIRHVNPNIAHVASRWTNRNLQTRQPQTTDMTWVLRKESSQWRIGGMAITPFEGEPPLLLNFEDPADMLQQKKMLNEEMARRAKQAASSPAVAEKPESAPVQR